MTKDRVLANQTVVVTGDRITAVGPAKTTRVPEGATRIDGQGKFLMPGLAEMHGHIPPPTAPRELVDNVLFLYVAAGVTTVRGMQGAPGQLDLREAAKRGEIVAPNLYLAGPQFSGNAVKSAEDAAARVRQQKSEGWDLLKVQEGLALDAYDSMAKTAKEVGIRFGGHVPGRASTCSTRSTWDRKPSITSTATSSTSTAARRSSTTRRCRISCSAPARPGRGSCRRWWCGRRCRDR